MTEWIWYVSSAMKAVADDSHSHLISGRAAALVLIGVDLGRVTTSLAVGSLDASGGLAGVHARSERHFGEPLQPFLRLYGELGAGAVAGVAATGVYGDRLAPPVTAGLPEEIALEHLVRERYPDGGPINVVRIGGGVYSLLTRNERGDFAYERNDRCSAGTGEVIERLCARLGATLDEAIALAAESDDGVAVTARCAVFAKSELTHYANQGEPHGRIFRGYFESVARNVHSLYDKAKVPGRVVLIGHVAAVRPIAAAFELLVGAPVEVPADCGEFEALGALAYLKAAGRPMATKWPADPARLVRSVARRVRSLTPAAAGPGSVVRLEAPPAAVGGAVAVLGLDLGSTGSKAVLLDPADGAVLADVYRRTDGSPVEAAQALVAEIREKADAAVVAVGLTGSGRDAAATVFRAAYPEPGVRLRVENEIVAHATAAVRYDPDAGRSLSIVEIGGQDAKFINVRGGHIVDSDMNRVCSAGTGSFLEEQAMAYGLDDVGRLGDLAARSVRPPDLGQMCTVFVADVAAEAVSDGYSVEDIFAGLQFSVIRNYKNRVMGNRQFLQRVFFQGKPATNPSLGRTLAAVTGREVWVPPNPGAMGAVGIAMLAAENVGDGGDLTAIDLSRILTARVAERREFRCRDRSCRNFCRVESAAVEVAGERRKVVSGGTCPKYDAVSAGGRKLPKEAPNPYRERAELLQGLLDEDHVGPAASQGPRVGIPYSNYLVDSLPFFHAFFTHLGAQVDVLRADPRALAEGDRRCVAPGCCAPAKLLHGLAGTEIDFLFAPTFVNVPYPGAGSVASTCPVAQGAPEMLERALHAEGATVRVLRPVLFRRGGDYGAESLAGELLPVARAVAAAVGDAPLKASRALFREALRAAGERQRSFEIGLHEIGLRALAFARDEGYPVVLVGGETHVIHEPLLASGIEELVAANGAVALPVDCFRVPAQTPKLGRVHWASARSTLRASVAAVGAGDVFPMLIGTYGCGPNSFVEHFFNDLLEGYPHTVLESDAHGGKAGYVTRVQAFLYSVRAYMAGHPAAEPVDAKRLARYDAPVPKSLFGGDGRTIIFGTVGGSVGRHVTAALRGRGLDVRHVGVSDADALERAQAACSGKECVPYQIVWGTLARFLAQEELPADGRKALFLSVGNGFQSCRANVFPLAEQIALEKLGYGDRVEVGDLTLVTENLPAAPAVWSAVVAFDLLNMVRFYHLASERTRGDADSLFERWSRELEATLDRGGYGARGANGLRATRETVARVEDLVGRAAATFGELPRADERELRDVFLCGDIFLRVDEWGNGGLQRKLGDLGVRAICEPFGEFFELLALNDMLDAPRASRRALKRGLTLLLMRAIARRLVRAAGPSQPWLFWHDVRRVEAESRRLFDGYPFGESIPTIGSALLTWRTQPVDGVVVVGPRGCGPALISEAQLRRSEGLPLLFVYNDGDPIDEARLAGFAWRLRGRPARRAPHVAGRR